MKISFIGGLGFIGKRAVRNLIKNNHEVTVLDIRKPETQKNDFKFIHQDVRDFNSLVDNLKKEKPEAVYDLAGTTLNEEGQNPRYSVGLDVWGLSNVFEACTQLNINKILYSSSFYVYQGISPSETVDETRRSSPFLASLLGSSKIAGERVVQSYTQDNDISYVVFRFGSAYGFDSRCTAVPYFLFKEGLETGKITIWGKGDRMNQYTFVEDIAAGVARSVELENEVINLIGPERTSMKQLAEIFQKEFNFEPIFLTDKKEGPSFPSMSSDKAKKLIDWKTTSVADGLRKTYQQFKG